MKALQKDTSQKHGDLKAILMATFEDVNYALFNVLLNVLLFQLLILMEILQEG